MEKQKQSLEQNISCLSKAIEMSNQLFELRDRSKNEKAKFYLNRAAIILLMGGPFWQVKFYLNKAYSCCFSLEILSAQEQFS